MTKTYKRKQYTNVEAFVYTNFCDTPEWFKEKYFNHEIIFGLDGKINFKTKNGVAVGTYGDYIVKNGKGCVYPVLHDVFLELYEEV